MLADLAELKAQTDGIRVAIQCAAKDKKAMLDTILGTEQDVLNWERKLQLEKEMQDVLDPTVGQVGLPVGRVELRKRE